MLHVPISHLKKEPSEDDAEETLYLAALSKLFGLENK
jgi:hypothetical protein